MSKSLRLSFLTFGSIADASKLFHFGEMAPAPRLQRRTCWPTSPWLLGTTCFTSQGR